MTSSKSSIESPVIGRKSEDFRVVSSFDKQFSAQKYEPEQELPISVSVF